MSSFTLYGKIYNTRQNYSFLVMAAVALALLIDVTTKAYEAYGSLAVLALLAGAFLFFPRWYRAIRRQQPQLGPAPSRLLRATQTMKFLFRIHFAVMIAMRVSLVVAAVAAGILYSELGVVLALIGVGAIAFVNVQPDQCDFLRQCRRCARPTARIFFDEGSCPTCEQQNYRDREVRQQALEQQARAGFNLDKVDALMDSVTAKKISKKNILQIGKKKTFPHGPQLTFAQKAERRLFERERKKAANL